MDPTGKRETVSGDGAEIGTWMRSRHWIRELLVHLRSDLSSTDHTAGFALIYAAIGLTCISYLRDPYYLDLLLRDTSLDRIGREAVDPTNNNLYALIWWVLVNLTFY